VNDAASPINVDSAPHSSNNNNDFPTISTFRRFLIRVNDKIRRYPFRSRSFTRLVFGVIPSSPATVQNYCEWGTLAMCFFMKRYLFPGARVLDMGTGTHGVLALVAKKCHPDSLVVAADILPERIEAARETSSRNNTDIKFAVSNMFENIPESFDVAIFCPPMTPTRLLQQLGNIPVELPGQGTRWDWSADGGEDGMDVLRMFLCEVRNHLSKGGLALVSFNPLDCPPHRMDDLARDAGLSVNKVHHFLGIMNVYSLCVSNSVS